MTDMNVGRQTHSHPVTEVSLEYADVTELREWADAVGHSGPVASSAFGDEFYEVTVRTIYMGVEMTFTRGDHLVHTIALYGGIPSGDDVERYREAGGF